MVISTKEFDKKRIESEMNEKQAAVNNNQQVYNFQHKMASKVFGHGKQTPIICTSEINNTFSYDGEFSIKLHEVRDMHMEVENKQKHDIVIDGLNSKIKDNVIITKTNLKDLSQFEMLKVIGRGTFGKVVLVRNKFDNHLYALKCLKKSHIIATRNLTNLKNEKKILMKIDSPFIIKLRHTFQSKDKIFMTFDYYNGGELFFHLQKFRRFPEEMAKFYAAEIYCALSYLHSKRIMYRDLKPENVILDDEGHIKLIDFGLAKDNCDMHSPTSSFCGTNEYIPPEILAGEPYGENFDWWGFGIFIYEMLYGRVTIKFNYLASLH